MTVELDAGEFIAWVMNEDLEEEDPLSRYQSLKLRIAELAKQDEFFGVRLALLGSSDDPETQRLIIEEFSQGTVLQCGFGKSLSKFWKKHKVAILVGVCIVAAVTAIGIAIACGSGAAAAVSGGAAAAGEAIANNPQGSSEDKKFSHSTSLTLEDLFLKPEEIARIQTIDEAIKERMILPHMPDLQIGHSSEQQLPKNQFFLPKEKFQEPFFDLKYEPKLWMNEPYQTWNYFPEQVLPIPPVQPHPFSLPPSSICHIPGINTTLEETYLQNQYLASLASHAIESITKRSYGGWLDACREFFINYAGHSFTSLDIAAKWREFHNDNLANPQLKMLWFCHSGGATDTYNALSSLPEEIRERIIVVAIAPATVIPDQFCYKSFNYASKGRDFVHYGEIAHAVLSPESFPIPDVSGILTAIEHHKELILLEPHPDAPNLLDHAFMSPTFQDKIVEHLQDHIKNKGTYL